MISIRLNLLKKNIPPSLDISDLFFLAREFVRLIDFEGDESIKEIKQNIQEAKTLLFQMIGRYIILLSRRDLVHEDYLSLGLRLKFEEDVRAILSNLKEKHYGVGLENAIGFSELMVYAGELKTAFDFLIYNPIVEANKIYKGSTDEYLFHLFRSVRANASVLGGSDKGSGISTDSVSKIMVPKPSKFIRDSFVKQGDIHPIVGDTEISEPIENLGDPVDETETETEIPKEFEGQEI